MEKKKRVVVLVIIAIILAITAVSLNVMSSDEVSTRDPSEGSGSAQVGINIQPAPVEDKLTQETPQP